MAAEGGVDVSAKLPAITARTARATRQVFFTNVRTAVRKHELRGLPGPEEVAWPSSSVTPGWPVAHPRRAQHFRSMIQRLAALLPMRDDLNQL